MKTIPPPCPEPETARRYWRSLDQLAETPEFNEWLQREFPAGASEFTDPVSRRHFVKIMSASFMLAGLGLAGTGCRRPEDKILPFGKAPEGYAHGVAQSYATAFPTRGGAIPLVVESHDGRPTKIEGNALHPDSNGGTNLHAQASILNLYDPDRAQRFTKAGNTVAREAALDGLKELSAQFATRQGEGLFILLDHSNSPSRQLVEMVLRQRLPKAKWFAYEPVDYSVGPRTATDVHLQLQAGQSPVLSPYYKLDQAKAILTLDCDFIGSEEDNHRLIRDFAKGRRLENKDGAMNRLYCVESLMTLTGFNADHRLRVAGGAVIQVAAKLAAEILTSVGPTAAPMLQALKAVGEPAGVDPKWITECARDLLANKADPAQNKPSTALVIAGHRQPPAVHIIAHAINAALGNLNQTVVLHSVPASNYAGIADLQHDIAEGAVNTLVIVGGNPAYNAPADLDFGGTVQRSKINVVRLGYYEDETFPLCTWHMPAAHFLESWGDARTSDGTWVPVQPLIEPLFGGLTDLEFLARLGGLEQTRPHDIVQATLKPIAGFDDFDNKWKKFLHDGFLASSAAKPALAGFDYSRATLKLGTLSAPAKLSKDNLELTFHRDYSLDDGRYNNNGWLQELPDPITKITWDNAVLVSRKTAEELGWKNGDILEIEVPLGGDKPKARVQGAVWIQPGQADYTLGLALGYGRKKGNGTGRVGHDVGLYNAYAIRTGAAPHYAAGAKVTKTGRKFKFSLTQDHGSMEGRPIIREANLADFKKKPDFAKNFDLESPGHSAHIAKGADGNPLGIYKHPYKQYEEQKAKGEATGPIMKSDVHQWGMSIDLSSCVGCSACMMACQSENNIPIVGKEQVGKGREMHWLRLDRYYSGASEKAASNLIDDPQVVTQPMLCQHCENAPCESVCPVNATVHDEEGLNVMAYNRCVGTRYCSNNCPYKVRRFNFFDYNRRPLGELYKNPITATTKGEWELKRWFKKPNEGSLPDDQWELVKLIKNPDVSVRMRGVMEKCTFCVQRIEQAKIGQKVKAGASGDVAVPDGTFKTACEQACPAQAIVFGNLLDPNSRVSKLKKQERDYSVLGFLDTRPRLTYLAKIRNPNPAMPDYTPMPLNLKEYVDHNGSPFEEHGTNALRSAEKKGAGH